MKFLKVSLEYRLMVLLFKFYHKIIDLKLSELFAHIYLSFIYFYSNLLSLLVVKKLIIFNNTINKRFFFFFVLCSHKMILGFHTVDKFNVINFSIFVEISIFHNLINFLIIH